MQLNIEKLFFFVSWGQNQMSRVWNHNKWEWKIQKIQDLLNHSIYVCMQAIWLISFKILSFFKRKYVVCMYISQNALKIISKKLHHTSFFSIIVHFEFLFFFKKKCIQRNQDYIKAQLIFWKNLIHVIFTFSLVKLLVYHSKSKCLWM